MIEIQTRVTDVTVFVDGARVTRRGRVDVEAGTQTIAIQELSPHIVSDSVRIGGLGNATLVNISVVQVEDPDTGRAAVKDLKRTIREIEAQIAMHKDALQRIEEQAKYLALMGQALGSEIGRASAEADEQALSLLTETNEWIRERVLSLKHEAREIRQDVERLNKELKAHEETLNDMLGEETRFTQLVVVLDVPDKCSLDLVAEYQVQGADSVSYTHLTLPTKA